MARPLDRHPDTVLVNARVLTVDRAFTVAEALAVMGDRVVAVGPSDRIAALAEHIRARVKERFGIVLQEEPIFL